MSFFKAWAIIMALIFFNSTAFLFGQKVSYSPEEIRTLSPEWKGERLADGRPKVSDELLERLKLVTHEEAWAVMKNAN